MERTQIIRDLRLGVYDVLVGINLLREGLDIPEVSLVAVLDADKEGLFRSETALIQTIGRAARNAGGHVILYADHITDSMHAAMEETERRRTIQSRYNEEHGIVPRTIVKEVRDLIEIGKPVGTAKQGRKRTAVEDKPKTEKERKTLIEGLTAEMKNAAKQLDFERAAFLRDRIADLQRDDAPADKQ